MKYNCYILYKFFILLLFTVITLPVSAQTASSKARIHSTNYSILSTENITICNNQLPFLWNGLTCPTAGNYSVTLTATNGSDSVATLILNVINIGTSITNAVICNNQLPYSWNGNTYVTDGTYSVTLTSSSGCDSVPILSLTVNDVVTSTTNNVICSNQLPFNWNSINYSAAGTYIATLVSAAGCDSIATLNLSVKPVTFSTTNSVICSNQFPFTWNGNSYATAGSYQVTITGSNGCDSIATLNLTTKPTTFSNTSVSICSNQLPYQWNGNSYATGGTFQVNLPGSNGCDSIATIIINIRPVANSTTNISICAGQLPYVWNGSSYNTAGTFPLTFSGSNGCDSIARLHLTIIPFLTSITEQIVCVTDLPYSWNGNSYLLPGNYTAAFVTSAGCDSIATLQLTVDSSQDTQLTLIICNNELPFVWNGYVFASTGTYGISPSVNVGGCDWISSLELLIQPVLPSTATVSICNNQLPYSWNGNNYTMSGLYGITLTSSAGCDSLANLALTVNPISTSSTIASICTNQLPFNWNGTNYATSGTHTANLVSVNGCDSLATVVLTVNPVKTSTTTLSICNGQLPFTWNGNNYPGAGIFSVTLTATNGCDSVATLNLSVLTFLSSTTNITICSNQLPFLWNGNTYISGGSFTVTLLSSAGCDSIVTLNLTENNAIVSNTILNICNTQLPFSWNGNSYAAAGNYSITLISSNGCDSIAGLTLLAGNAVTSTTTSTICNNQLPYNWNGNSYPVAGTYPVTLTSSSGCDSIATLNLLVTDILTSTTNVTLCTSELPYSWNGNSYSVAGTYSFTTTTSGGCDSVPILSLAVVPYVTSTTAITICNNELPYNWNGETYITAGTYAVLLNGTGACDSLATIILNVLPPISSTTTMAVCASQFPFSWNGNSYASPGIYNITLISSGGCDSIATLQLSEIPIAISNTIFTTCVNELPYQWNGNDYGTAGSYSITLSGSNGCDSIATLVLLVNPTLSSNNNINICINQLPYSWNGNSYGSAGNYSVTLNGSNGCDSVATLILTATPVVTSETIVSICNSALPYSWNGNSYANAGLYTVTLAGSSGCDSVASLQLITIPLATGSTTVTTCNNQLPYFWNGNNYNTAGVYATTLVSSAGCDSIATLNLFVNETSTSNTVASICNNQLPYNWNGQAYNTSGNYPITLNNSSGCDSIATLLLTVSQIQLSSHSISVCSSELPFNWNGQNYNNSGSYTANLVSTNGCDSIATLILHVNPSPIIPAVVSPIIYCEQDDAVTLSAAITTTGSTLQWYSMATGGTANMNAPTPSTLVVGTTNYYVSQLLGNCEGPRALITVTVNSKPNLGPDKELKICFGQTANISGLYDTTGIIGNWTQNGSVANDLTTVGIAGIFQLDVINNNGCTDTVLVNLSIQPQLIADAGNDADIEYNVPFQLSGSGGGTYQWSPSNLFNNPFIVNPAVTLTADATLVLLVTDDIGCIDLDTVNFRVLNGPTFYVPSAFTPNGDGLNDTFKPIGVGIASIEYFRIFNRYGELVFETSEIGKGWDGIYRGVKQPGGNFVWSLKGTDRKGSLKTMKGNVVLIR